MKIFVAGATGAIGAPLVRQLIAAGHDVVGLTRSEARSGELRNAGAEPVVCDVFDIDKLRRAVECSKPEIVIHQLTAIPKRIDPRKIKSQLEATNRLRTTGTRNLLEAACAGGARRFISQSIAFAYRPDGDTLKTEEAALYEDAPPSYADVISSVRSLESTTLTDSRIEGIVLRYGFFYGPGTAYASDGSFAEDVRRRKVPLMGSAQGVFSFVHVEDAAAATVAAVRNEETGIYNIVDDEPAPVADWLPVYAEGLGARVPVRAPRLLGRLIAGPYATYLMCEQRGASNAKAKAKLRLSLRFPSWRQGFRE